MWEEKARESVLNEEKKTTTAQESDDALMRTPRGGGNRRFVKRCKLSAKGKRLQKSRI